MLQNADHYPTRTDDKREVFDRREPVIHSEGDERENGPLGVSQLDQFERDGFLWLEGFFPQERIEPFFEELDAMARDPEIRDRDEVIMDADKTEIRSVFAMHELSEAFDQMTRDPRLLGMAQQILGGDVYIHQSRINSKAGFSGGGFNWHSDFETWHSEDGMPKMRAISASIMLTDNNAFNGPLMLIPGSHNRFVPCVGKTPDNNWLQSLKSQEIGVPDQESIAELANARGIEAPTGRAGSLLLFDCNTLHASNANLSPWPRANLFFVYNSIENRLADPFSGTKPRPEYLGARQRNIALTPNH